ncbi:hypothetical protein INS49_003031 [Diaporthe citri]|uniref:uncharacterized protein n=1 Tax=Diaporthe citri TaxID=83186 RepID=UPI001C8121E1|nr:uncharacterized protein INS49_003031 [Diaporthe citri]KAG6368815.1 hypothetical protein INS49_003031 [Diaporthe citri]
MRLLTNIVLLGFGLVGSALAKSICCMPGCNVCLPQQCLWGGYCAIGTNFNTCCADEKKAMIFKNEEDYLAAVAAGQIDG